jgi:hypothetical protein
MLTKVIDFATSFDPVLWQEFQEFVVTTNDNLVPNYIGLDPCDFACFPVIIVDDKIVCFSALQISPDRWGPGIGRVSTRMWIHPDYRHKGMTKFQGGDKFLNTTYCLPLQLAAAQRHNLDCVFVSREHNFKAFQKYRDLIAVNCKTEFEVEPMQYNVCGPQETVPNSCRQWVLVKHLTQAGPKVWAEQMTQYQLL